MSAQSVMNPAGEPPRRKVWDAQWAKVPAEWKIGIYSLNETPFDEVFVRNTNYLRSEKKYSFAPLTSDLMGDELAWWLWSIWSDGARKIDPAMLAWWSRAIDSINGRTGSRPCDPGRASVADFDPEMVIAEGVRLFVEKNGREPSAGNKANLTGAAQSVFRYVTIRCSEANWWEHDVWSLLLDPRIPRRPHEPMEHRPVNLGAVEPEWLREGLRFWLSQMLIHDTLVWSTVGSRLSEVGRHFGQFCVDNDITEPSLVGTAVEVRDVATRYLAWLHTPDAAQGPTAMRPASIASCRTALHRFYQYQFACRDELVAATGDKRWGKLNEIHAAIFPPSYHRSRKFNKTAPKHHTAQDMQRMMVYLPILGAPTNQTLTVGGTPDGPVITVSGRGDPAGMRAWLLQALTGRRQSEVLMLDFDPITPLPDIGDLKDASPDAFVARLRYQQTKVDNVDPTILVEPPVVAIIREQQQWVRAKFPELKDPPYLFPNPRGNHRGVRARQASSYATRLRNFDKLLNLIGDDMKPLRYSQTHRLRHTKATELLNAGVPIHVLQRYLGHSSPEMSMLYAATLEATAEAEFLRYKRVGASGRDLGIAPRDVLDMTRLAGRADRALPNGLCMLPPSQACDRGNACLTCPSFATDATHLDQLREQRERSKKLIEVHTRQYRKRTGQDMVDTNVWLLGRRAEVAALDATIARLEATPYETIVGAGATPMTLIADPSDAASLHNELADRLEGGGKANDQAGPAS